jgi:GDP-L-fucose synthase
MVLVTGATGFLGKHICKKLEKQNTDFFKSSLSLGVDLRNNRQCEELFSSIMPDFVLHCAAYVGGIQFGLKHQAEIFYNNMLITLNLFNCCVKFKTKRLVNPISNCAYPGNATLFREGEFWNGPLHDSVTTYGMTRKISHIGALAYKKQYGLDTVNLILSNMYGPEDHFDEERSHALGALIKKIVEAKINSHDSVVIWGTGKPVREWLFVEDGAEAMIRSMNIPPYQNIINIGVSKGISINDMAQMICSIVGYKGKLVFDSSKEDGAPFKTVDGTLGKKLLKWQPQTDFANGIEKTIDWYIKNRVV